MTFRTEGVTGRCAMQQCQKIPTSCSSSWISDSMKSAQWALNKGLNNTEDSSSFLTVCDPELLRVPEILAAHLPHGLVSWPSRGALDLGSPRDHLGRRRTKSKLGPLPGAGLERVRGQILQNSNLLEVLPLAWIHFRHSSQGPLGLCVSVFVLFYVHKGAPPGLSGLVVWWPLSPWSSKV